MSQKNFIIEDFKISNKFKSIRDSYKVEMIGDLILIQINNKGNDVVKIDVEDSYIIDVFSSITKHRSHYKVNRSIETRYGFAQESYYIHRVVMRCTKQYTYGSNKHIDHKDRDPSNNSKANLRFCTISENNSNTVKNKKSSTGFRGVCKKNNLSKPYVAYIKVDGKTRNLGYFETAEEAAREYDRKAKELKGDFAVLNFT